MKVLILLLILLLYGCTQEYTIQTKENNDPIEGINVSLLEDNQTLSLSDNIHLKIENQLSETILTGEHYNLYLYNNVDDWEHIPLSIDFPDIEVLIQNNQTHIFEISLNDLEDYGSGLYYLQKEFWLESETPNSHSSNEIIKHFELIK